MNIDENDFFREATILICGHLKIEDAMASCLGRLKKIMPADAMFLDLYERDFGVIRTIASVTVEGGEKIDRLTPRPPEVRDEFEKAVKTYVKTGELPATKVVNRPELDPVTRTMVQDFQTPDMSYLIMPLMIEGRWVGNVVLECIGKDRYSAKDAQRLVAGYVEHYNTVRLHSDIGYVTPKDKLEGRKQDIFAARDRKLETAREARKQRRQNRVNKGVQPMMN